MPRLPDALSFCIIAKNEERNLPRCLDSVKDLTSKMILVDTGSTDGTTDIAADYGAQVIRFDYTFVDVAAARNCAISHARSPCILMLDADEALAQETSGQIEKLIAQGETVG